MRYKDAFARLSKIPPLPLLARKALDLESSGLTYIPIYQNVELPPGTVAPAEIIRHFIEEAAHHVIIRKCLCRTAMECSDYDREFGCTFLGEGAREIDPAIGRHVTKEEALDHFREACQMGLISVVGKFKGDAYALGVREHDRLMTVCHCCPCCCVTTSLRYAPRQARDVLVRLEGLEVRVGDECTGCGRCADACVFGQMSVVNGRAVVGEECKGCGRCAMVCEKGAISISLNDPGYMEECLSRISASVKVD